MRGNTTRFVGVLVVLACGGNSMFAEEVPCCTNVYYLSGNLLCSGPSVVSCDAAPTQGSGKQGSSYRAEGCYTYTGQFATGGCNASPGTGWITIPGYKDASGNCCWFKGNPPTFAPSGNQVQDCAGAAC